MYLNQYAPRAASNELGGLFNWIGSIFSGGSNAANVAVKVAQNTRAVGSAAGVAAKIAKASTFVPGVVNAAAVAAKTAQAARLLPAVASAAGAASKVSAAISPGTIATIAQAATVFPDLIPIAAALTGGGGGTPLAPGSQALASDASTPQQAIDPNNPLAPYIGPDGSVAYAPQIPSWVMPVAIGAGALILLTSLGNRNHRRRA